MRWVTMREASAITRKLGFKKNLILSEDRRAELLLEQLLPLFEACERTLNIEARRSCERQKREACLAVSERMRARASAYAAGEFGEPTSLSEEISNMPLTTYDNMPDGTYKGIE